MNKYLKKEKLKKHNSELRYKIVIDSKI